jgi:hypothetical protein
LHHFGGHLIGIILVVNISNLNLRQSVLIYTVTNDNSDTTPFSALPTTPLLISDFKFLFINIATISRKNVALAPEEIPKFFMTPIRYSLEFSYP